MFGGEETDVYLSVRNELIGVIVDRFGSNIFIRQESENTFQVSIKAVLSPQFYAWLFGLGNRVKIISPQNAIDEYRTRVEAVKSQYL